MRASWHQFINVDEIRDGYRHSTWRERDDETRSCIASRACADVVGGAGSRFGGDIVRAGGEDGGRPLPPTPTVAHRVPAYFGQVELTEEQRKKIYALQDAQQPGIDRLKQQHEAARAKLLSDTEAVLTAPQREKLATLRSAAKAKSLARSQARAKARETAPAPVAKKAG